MNFEELQTLVGDNEEAKVFVNSLQSTQKDNVTRINTLETQVTDITTTRDKYKNGNKLIKDSFGLENINEDSISEYLSNMKKGKNDEAFTSEITNLKSLLETATNEKTTLTNDYESKIQDIGITNSLRDLGIDSLASSTRTAQDILRELKSGAMVENGEIVYKKDGQTEYINGKVATPADKLSQLKSSDEFKPYFKPDALNGSGTQNSNGNGNKKPAEYTESERIDMSRNNPTLFKQIFNQ